MISSRIVIAIMFGFLFGLFSGVLIGFETYTYKIIPALIFDLFLGFLFAWALITGEKQ